MEGLTATVICLCYNQGRFVREAIQSVFDQTYPNVELLVVDDASSDDSVAVIRACLQGHPQIKFFPLETNSGNCRALNVALAHAKGDFIVDLAADDILMPDRIAEGVKDLELAGSEYGVHFTDALWIGENGERLHLHSERFPHDGIPQGNVYRDLISRFFICSPTMMFKAGVIRSLGGYDESLAYEDFDFWIRSSRLFKYCYSPKVLAKKRVVRNSMSQKQFSFFNPQLESTFHVCEKIMALNRSGEEQKALSKRIFYEMRVCIRLFHFTLFWRYAGLLIRNSRRQYLE